MASLGLWILFLLFVVTGAVFGVIRELNKSVVRLMLMAVAMIITFFVAGPVTRLLVGCISINGETLGQMLMNSMQNGDMASILESSPLFQSIILALPAFAVSIVVFPLIFMILSFISWIVFLFVKKPLCKLIFKDNCNKEENAAKPKKIRVAKRFGGLGVGVVTGILVFGMVLSPVLGLFSIMPSSDSVDRALTSAIDQDLISEADADLIRTIYEITDCPVSQIYRFIGISAAGRAYINSASKIKVDGQRIRLVNELKLLLSTVESTLDSGLMDILLAKEDSKGIMGILSDKELMNKLMQNLIGSKILSTLIPDLLAKATESIAQSMNLPANKEVVYDNMMDNIASAVKDADVDYDIIRRYEEAHGTTYSVMRTSVQYKIQKAASVPSKEAYDAQISKLIELSKTISSILNKAMAGDNAAFTDSVADRIVQEVKTQATGSGQSVVENFDASSVQNAITNISSSDVNAGEGDAAALLTQLTDKTQFETSVATVESIASSIQETVKNALADESKASETASTLASVVSDLASAVESATDENGEQDISKMDFSKIADAVTTLQNSTLKDVGTSMLDMVAAGDLGENNMLGDVVESLKEGYANGEDIGGTINSAGALINLGSAMNNNNGNTPDGEENQEALVSSLTDLINNLNEFTIKLLPSILSTDTITSLGVPKEFADTTFGIIETLLKELMKLKGAENYDNEVNSILSLYNLITSGVENFTEDDIGKLAKYAINSDAIFNTLVSVSTSNPFGIEIPDSSTRNSLINSIEKNYKQSGKTQRELDTYKAIANLLGLDADVNLK